MKKTRICELLGIEYPIIQAPMGRIGGAELAAAVSNAGALGTLSINAGAKTRADTADVERVTELMRIQIREVRRLTGKPFAVNLVVGFGRQRPFNERSFQVALEEGIQVAVVSAGPPDIYTQRLKEIRAKVFHVIGSVEHAKKAEAAGVDGVICIGYEAGGHLSPEELTTFVLVPQVVDAVKIPVIAGGGISDARGAVAAFALGADAVYLGTRFLATYECAAHLAMKQAVLDAIDTSTVAYGRRTFMHRGLKNEHAKKYIELESKGASFEELRDMERFHPGDTEVLDTDDIVHRSIGCGAGSGMIKEIVSAAEVVRSIVEDVSKVVASLK